MNNYPPEMYNEILKYENFSYGKFLEIPYPTINQQTKLHHGNQQRNPKIAKPSN